jgi:hypothetical protein
MDNQHILCACYSSTIAEELAGVGNGFGISVIEKMFSSYPSFFWERLGT